MAGIVYINNTSPSAIQAWLPHQQPQRMDATSPIAAIKADIQDRKRQLVVKELVQNVVNIVRAGERERAQQAQQEQEAQEAARNNGAFLLLCYKQLISKGARLRIAWVMRGSLPVQMHAVCCTVARGLLAPLFHTHPCAPHNLQRTCR